MKYTYEIYLTKKNTSSSDWEAFINTISKYNGLFRWWKIIIINNKNQIRYLVKTRCSLPTTINNLDSFLLKPYKNVKLPNIKTYGVSYTNLNNNIIDLINYNKIKNKGNLKYCEINNILINTKIFSNINYYLYKNKILKKYRLLFSIPKNVLAVDFNSNKRFFYKSSPKYLDISKILHLLNTDSNNALLNIDTFPYLQGNFYLNQNSYSFNKHSVIFGSSGCGKSKFISLFIKNIYKNKVIRDRYKFIVIDPHAALDADIGGVGKVIDFEDDNCIDLFINENTDVISSVELLLDLFKSLLADQYNSKLERVLRHSIYLLLTDKSFSFKKLRQLLLDVEYRNDLIKKSKDNLTSSVSNFFLSEYNDLKTKSYGEAISPIIGFIDEMEMLPVFNLDYKFNSLKDTLDNNFLTLFSLNKIKLGDRVTKTIAGLIMQQVMNYIQKRYSDKQIIFIVDEVAVVENKILCRFLSEARKYNLSLVLAGQYFNQISDELKRCIFANVVNYYIFRVSRADALALVDNINMKIAVDDNVDNKVKILTELNNRECIVRIDSKDILLPAFKAKTLDYVSIPRIKVNKNIEKIAHNERDIKKSKFDFKMDNNISMKDILISNSTSRKVIK